MATAIQKYKLKNESGANIFPQLRDASNHDTILWDARYISGTVHMLMINQEVTVDLAVTGSSLTGKKFILACNTVWGNDKWDPGFIFTYDSTCGVTTSATAFGAAKNGSLNWNSNSGPPRSLVSEDDDTEEHPPSYAETTYQLMKLIETGGVKNAKLGPNDYAEDAEAQGPKFA